MTDRRSIFIRQPKTRSGFVLRGEMRFGTALVTDVPLKRFEDYEQTSLETLALDGENLVVLHESVVSLSMKGDPIMPRKRDFFVWMVMRRQKETFQVYNFHMRYMTSKGEEELRFYAVPLGSYFKPRRQMQTRETILREYAISVAEVYRQVLPSGKISLEPFEPRAASEPVSS